MGDCDAQGVQTFVLHYDDSTLLANSQSSPEVVTLSDMSLSFCSKRRKKKVVNQLSNRLITWKNIASMNLSLKKPKFQHWIGML